jgi:hypothetical protein
MSYITYYIIAPCLSSLSCACLLQGLQYLYTCLFRFLFLFDSLHGFRVRHRRLRSGRLGRGGTRRILLFGLFLLILGSRLVHDGLALFNQFLLLGIQQGYHQDWVLIASHVALLVELTVQPSTGFVALAVDRRTLLVGNVRVFLVRLRFIHSLVVRCEKVLQDGDRHGPGFRL